MNKIILFLFAVVTVSQVLSAQEDNRAQFQLGIKAGTNFANVYDEQGDEFRADGKFGFVAGAFMTIPLASVIGIQPEVLFSQKGFKATGNLLGSTYGLTRTSSYIDVPLYLSIKPINALTLVIGPQFSFLLKQKDVYENSVTTVEQIQEFENDNLRKNIFGISTGFDLNMDKLVFGARAGWDLSTNHGDGTSSTPRYKNAWLQATLGFRLL
jgi:hypothetical protein